MGAAYLDVPSGSGGSGRGPARAGASPGSLDAHRRAAGTQEGAPRSPRPRARLHDDGCLAPPLVPPPLHARTPVCLSPQPHC